MEALTKQNLYTSFNLTQQQNIGNWAILDLSDLNKVDLILISFKITDRITRACISANFIEFITCTLCKTLYMGETGRRLGDQFRNVEKRLFSQVRQAKPVTRHVNLPNLFKQHMGYHGKPQRSGTKIKSFKSVLQMPTV